MQRRGKKKKKTYSLSRKRWNSSSPTLTGDPPYCNRPTISDSESFFPYSTQATQAVGPLNLELPTPTALTRTYLRNQNTVAVGDTHRQTLALPVESAGSNSEDLAFVELLDARLGQEEAAGRLGVGLDALYQHAVQQRDEGLD
jgi:hypothetical protein